MKVGRNESCPCGSGKKYKHCHYGRAFSAERDMSVNARNRMLLAAAVEIFGFDRGRDWQDFKRTISAKEVRKFYEFQAELWRPETDWATILPKADARLRGLYLGDIQPERILQNTVRFSLYSDQILIVDPFLNPWNLRPAYNPIENPGQYKSDTLKLVYCLMQIAPWIESGVVQLIPDPGDFDHVLQRETWKLARARRANKPIHASDLAETRAIGQQELERFLYALPDDQLLRQVAKSGQELTDEQKRDFLEYARRKQRSDPLALEQHPGQTEQDGQITAVRGGANLETALIISGLTGAFPYTNSATRWEELIEAREELGETARIWSPFAKAFQALQFKFLNTVDVEFANKIREDGRLETFRALLRKVGKDIQEIRSANSLEAFVRDCKDELTLEYHKAEADWGKIDESFIKWVGGGVATSSLITGHFIPDVASLSIATLHAVGQLWLRHIKRQQFRQANPMSVFIDLSRKEPPGFTLT